MSTSRFYFDESLWPLDPQPWQELSESDQIAALKLNPLGIRFLPQYQDNREFALAAVRVNGLAIAWLTRDLQRDYEIRNEAIKHMPLERTAKGIHHRIFFASLEEDKFSYIGEFLNDYEHFSGKQFLEWERDSNGLTLSGNILEPHVKSQNVCSVAIQEFFSECEETEVVELDPSSSESIYLRDSHVTLLEGGHYIPQPITQKQAQAFDYVGRAMVSFPSFFEGDSICAHGNLRQNVIRAKIAAYDYDISYKAAKTTIEGGNCFLFLDHEGYPRAIIGELSLYFSLLVLETNGHFKNVEIPDVKPSEESLRKAENLIKDDAIGPEEQKIKLQKLAQAIEAHEDKTLECIAEEIQIPKENIVIVPQTNYHIDLEMVVTPLGHVLVHDDEAVIRFLATINISNFNQEELDLYEEYMQAAQVREAKYRDFQEVRDSILSDAGLDFYKMPLIFYGRGRTLNFCNGIFKKNEHEDVNSDFLFITTGPSFQEENIFYEELQRYFYNKFQIALIGTPLMSSFLTEDTGGIHCLTFEDEPAWGRLPSISPKFQCD